MDIKKKIKGQEQKILLELLDYGYAIEIAYKNIDAYNKKLLDLREYYVSEVAKKISDIKINGDMLNRLSGNCNISFKNIDGEELLLKLDSARNMRFCRICM